MAYSVVMGLIDQYKWQEGQYQPCAFIGTVFLPQLRQGWVVWSSGCSFINFLHLVLAGSLLVYS